MRALGPTEPDTLQATFPHDHAACAGGDSHTPSQAKLAAHGVPGGPRPCRDTPRVATPSPCGPAPSPVLPLRPALVGVCRLQAVHLSKALARTEQQWLVWGLLRGAVSVRREVAGLPRGHFVSPPHP